MISASCFDVQDSLPVEPNHLRIRSAFPGETLREIARKMDNPRMSVENFSSLNRIEVDQPLEPGTLVKVIEAGRR